MRFQQYLFAKFHSYIPAEDSVAASIVVRLITVWMGIKILGVITGCCIIMFAVQHVGTIYHIVPHRLVSALNTAFKYFFPFFQELLFMSFTYLWQPILLYLTIAVITKSSFWRKFWCLVSVSGWFLLSASAIQDSSWKEVRLLPLLLLQGYVFLLWLLPREAWNFFGLVISSAIGLLILLLPDLPTAFDDFGMFSAVLVFFLGYVHLVASLTQRLVSRI